MNLNTLFRKQMELDAHITQKRGLEGQPLLDKRIVALICELYECVNEARFFKFWSEDQNATTKELIKCDDCKGRGFYHDGYGIEWECEVCSGIGDFGYKNPLLEEYIDTIHFALSIANDLGVHGHEYLPTRYQDLNLAVIGITNLATIIVYSRKKDHVRSLLNNLITLGYQFGFTETDVKKAYDKKNAENYERQKVGY